MKKFLTIAIIMLSVVAFSQEKNISGIVKDDTGYPMVGVAIVVKGTKNATMSDLDGRYYIKGNKGDVLRFSYIGMQTRNITIEDKATINVNLKTIETLLDDVVVIGYGSVKKSDLTGSVSTVKAEDITKSGAISIEQSLAGRAAGVVVTQGSGEPGSGASIKIRAIGSLNGSDPLYVIDGVPFENNAASGLGSEDTESQSMSPLSMINPSDIESIEVLKDASSTAIYGSRGANGVVLITTKQGKVGKGVISVDHESGLTTVTRFVDLLDSNEYVILNEEAWRNAGNLNPRSADRLALAHQGLVPNNDWQKTIIQVGTQNSTNISFSGGTKELKYLFSNNLTESKGIVAETDYKRISSRVNLTANVTDKFTVGTSINYSSATNNQSSINTSGNNIKGATSAINRALKAPPTTLIDDADDIEGIEEGSPIVQLRANKYHNLLTQLVGSMYGEYSFTKALKFKSTFTYQNRNTAQRYYQLNILPNNLAEGGRAKTGDGRSTSTSITNTLSYRNNSKKHNFNAVLGQSIEGRETETVKVSNFGFANDLLLYYDPGSATFNDPDVVNYDSNKLASVFGRINYTFNKKYLFTLTGRYDGSSKFSANNKWAFFPAGAFAYKFSEEKFMKRINAISELKFRVSYGTSGNQAVSSFESLDQYQSGIVPFNEQTSTIYYQSQLPNANLTWETTSQLDLGVDFGFFKNRLTGSFEYYNKITDDLLFKNNQISVVSGFSTYTENYGSLTTNGLEFSFNAKIINKKNFSWELRGNIATGKTKVQDMASNNLFSGWNPGFISGGTQRLIIGEEVGTFYGYKTAGIGQFDDFVEFQGLTNAERIAKYNAAPNATYTFVAGYTGGIPSDSSKQRPGEQLYEDVKKDGAFTEEDRTTIGQAQADYNFGINNSFHIGDFDFSFFIDAQQGQEIVNFTSINLLDFQGKQAYSVVLNRWTPESPSNLWPRVDSSNSRGDVFSDRFVEDGSFVRLQNVTLGYNFPNDLLHKLGLSSLRLYASATNLALWTKYYGFTPDVSARGSSNTNLGHDNSAYPAARLIRLGVNLKF